MKKFNTLYTPFEKDLGDVPYSQYPRPMMLRESFLPLNGKWELAITTNGKPTYHGDILVPFPVESRLSGAEKAVGQHDRLLYQRSFTIQEAFLKDKLLLHFGAVDQFCRVFVNGIPVGEHVGGYLPFSFDITKCSKIGENRLSVEVIDRLDLELPYGKQREKRGGMWYTPVSGIWQSVWLESVWDNAITSLSITTDLTSATVCVTGGCADKTLLLEGKSYAFCGDSITITVDNPQCWSPEHPKLYHFEIVSGKDSIKSYFALRTITVKGNQILLNGKPYFFHGVLDQGYFADGIYLPATEKGYENDILQMKAMGFNMLRKHIKIEPQIFYYYCDLYGMVVFQDMVNSGKYNFIFDTALPTIGFKKGFSHKATPKRKEQFMRSVSETVDLLHNHPCVCYYTLFNEGWGQFDAKNLYRWCKELDGSRVWDATSGWFQTGESDVQSEHVYFKPIKLARSDKPLVLSEFGGYSLKIPEHSFNLHKTYGYRLFSEKKKFEDAIEKLYLGEILPAIEKGLCGAVLTQLSDVEDETNGLLTYDRQLVKMNTQKMKAVSDRLYAAFEKLNT